MDYDSLRFGLDVVQFLLWAALGLYVWASNRHRATRDHIEKVRDAHDKRLDNHAERLTKAEEQLRHLPDSKTIQVLSDRLAELHGDFKGIKAELDGFRDLAGMLRRQLELMDEFLRKQGGIR